MKLAEWEPASGPRLPRTSVAGDLLGSRPGTARACDDAVRRLGSGAFADALRSAADGITAKLVDPADPLVVALADRRIRELGTGTRNADEVAARIRNDTVLEPLLATPGVAAALAAEESPFRDVLRLVGEHVDRIDTRPRPAIRAAIGEISARHSGRSAEDHARALRLLAVRGAPANYAACSTLPSRRVRQRWRAAEEGRPWPPGRGRPACHRNRDREARLASLLSSVRGLPREDQRRLVLDRRAPASLAEVLKRFRSEESARKGWRDSTKAQYRSVFARLSDSFGTTPIQAIRPKDVSAYVADRLDDGFAPATVSRDLSLLHSIFAYAAIRELVDRNPAASIPGPHGRQRQGHALSAANVQRLLRAFKPGRERIAFLTFVLTGLRRSELRELRWRDVDLIENVLRVLDAKTDTGIRAIAIPRWLAEELWQWRRQSAFQGDDEYVLAHPQKGTRFSYDEYRDALVAAFAEAGLEMPEKMRPCHDLRVTAITNDAIAGAHPIAVMTKAGHANMATTKRYLKMADVVFRAEADALEQRLLGGQLSTQLSTQLGESEASEGHSAPLEQAEADAADPAL